MMQNWLKKYKSNIPYSNMDATQLVDVFRHIDSIESTFNIFRLHGLLNDFGLVADKVTILLNVCALMRAKGMALEPNLIGRAAIKAIMQPKLSSQAAIEFSRVDNDFLAHIVLADAARDSKNFSEAQYQYWSALELLPSHPGYRTQYAHCLKERGLMTDALIEYINAYIFGENKNNIEQHAVFAAREINLYEEAQAFFNRPLAASQEPLDWPATSQDVKVLSQLLLGAPSSIDEIAHLMCISQNKRALFHKLIGHKEFIKTHRKTLCILNETGLEPV